MGVGLIGAPSNVAQVLPEGAIEKVATVTCSGIANLPTLSAGNYIVASTSPSAIYGTSFIGEQIALDSGTGTRFTLPSSRSDLSVELCAPTFARRPLPTGISQNWNRQNAHSSVAFPDRIIMTSAWSGANNSTLSTNGGDTWTQLSHPDSNRTSGFVDNVGDLYLDTDQSNNSGNGAKPMKSTNNGVNWSVFDTTAPGSPFTNRAGFAVNEGRWCALWANGSASTELRVTLGNVNSPTATQTITLSNLTSLSYGGNLWRTSVRPIPNSTWFVIATTTNNSGEYLLTWFDGANPPGSLSVNDSFISGRANNDARAAVPVVIGTTPYHRLMTTNITGIRAYFLGRGINSADTSVNAQYGNQTRNWMLSMGGNSTTSERSEVINRFSASSWNAQTDNIAATSYNRSVYLWGAFSKITASGQTWEEYRPESNVEKADKLFRMQNDSSRSETTTIARPGKPLRFFGGSSHYWEALPETITIYRAG